MVSTKDIKEKLNQELVNNDFSKGPCVVSKLYWPAGEHVDIALFNTTFELMSLGR
jgi:hypothetical protein